MVSKAKIAVVQMCSGEDLEENLARMSYFVDAAVSQSAQLVAFPEMAYLLGSADKKKRAALRYAEILKIFSAWAKQKRIFLCPGSLREPIAGSPLYYNTCPFFGPDGNLLANYRKIFLFKANLPERSYDESLECRAGSDVCAAPWNNISVGLSICFDLRFPELFRTLRNRLCQVILLPSAFTVPTGKAHWHTLIKARAIENQCFLVAPAQSGRGGDGNLRYGHSIVVGPWGQTLAERTDDGDGILTCDLDFQEILNSENKISVWESRRKDLFPI